MCHWLLHVWRMTHAGVSAVAFPALVVQLGVTSGQVTLALCARVLLMALALTAVVKVVMEDSSAALCYPTRRGMSVLGRSQAHAFFQHLAGVVPNSRSPHDVLCVSKELLDYQDKCY